MWLSFCIFPGFPHHFQDLPALCHQSADKPAAGRLLILQAFELIRAFSRNPGLVCIVIEIQLLPVFFRKEEHTGQTLSLPPVHRAHPLVGIQHGQAKLCIPAMLFQGFSHQAVKI